MLVQIDNRNQCWNLPLNTNQSPETLRDKYGDKIEGETVTVYDNNDNKFSWIYINGKYRSV